MRLLRLSNSILMGLTLFIAACGNPPLAQPQSLTQPPTTVEVVELAPTAEQTATTPEPEPTPTPTQTPETAPAKPTIPLEAEPTKTKVFLPSSPYQVTSVMTTSAQLYQQSLKDGGVTVGGYTFSLPQPVAYDRISVETVGWLPDSPDEIIETRSYQAVAVNMYTGQIREFSPPLPYPINPRHVRLLPHDFIAFRTTDGTDQDFSNFWITAAGEKQAKSPVAQEKEWWYTTILYAQEETIFFNAKSNRLEVLNPDGSTTPSTSIDLATVLSSAMGAVDPKEVLDNYRVTSSLVSRWTVFDNGERFILIDLKTGDTKEIAWNPQLRADTMYWSPDGQRLALLITEGPRPIPYMKLFILDVEREQLREIRTEFHYITNVTWAPDNENLLISADTGVALNAEGRVDYQTGDLFLVNIFSEQLDLIPILPKGSAINFVWRLSWAPDGQKIALSAFFAESDIRLYRIDVDKEK